MQSITPLFSGKRTAAVARFFQKEAPKLARNPYVQLTGGILALGVAGDVWVTQRPPAHLMTTYQGLNLSQMLLVLQETAQTSPFESWVTDHAKPPDEWRGAIRERFRLPPCDRHTAPVSGVIRAANGDEWLGSTVCTSTHRLPEPESGQAPGVPSPFQTMPTPRIRGPKEVL